MKSTCLLSILLLSLLLNSCRNIRSLNSKPPHPSIRVSKPFVSYQIWDRVEFPAGEYKPIYEDRWGYYYQAPRKLAANRLFYTPLLLDGGFYVYRAHRKEDVDAYTLSPEGRPYTFTVGNKPEISLTD
jgi:hypothetical protein